MSATLRGACIFLIVSMRFRSILTPSAVKTWPKNSSCFWFSWHYSLFKVRPFSNKYVMTALKLLSCTSGVAPNNYVIRDVFDAWNTMQDLGYCILKDFHWQKKFRNVVVCIWIDQHECRRSWWNGLLPVQRAGDRPWWGLTSRTCNCHSSHRSRHQE